MTEQPQQPQPTKEEVKRIVSNFFSISPKAKQILDKSTKEK